MTTKFYTDGNILYAEQDNGLGDARLVAITTLTAEARHLVTALNAALALREAAAASNPGVDSPVADAIRDFDAALEDL